jgi:hypothetical protein
VIPVSVRLANDNVDVHITNRLSGLSWRSVAPGGYASASFALERPIDVGDPMLATFTRVYIYDGRDGSTLWEGRLQLPGRSAGDNGQVWEITATGGSSHALDDQRSLIYVDRDLTSMAKNNSSPAAEATVDVDPGNAANEEAMVFRFPNGFSANTNSNVAFTYERIAQAQMFIGGVNYDWDSGFTNAAFEVQSVWNPGAVVVADACNVAGGSQNQWTGASDFLTTITFRMIRISGGALTIVGDLTWSSISNLNIRGRLLTKTGTAITGAANYANGYVFAHEVVADLLGRMLPLFDGANATIATTSAHIEQLAYAEPATADQVLTDLMAQESAYYWAAWESNPTTGKYRFEWKAWPVSARYEASVTDGFSSPAPAFELYNKALVRWKDPKQRIRLGPVTLAQTELDAAGLTRTGYIDISDEVGSAQNAINTGTSFLQDHNRVTAGGTLTVARPILDVIDGRTVWPWQIRAGELIRVKGVEASVDTADHDRDGLTVFRIVSVEPNEEGTATLELDMFTRSETRALAQLLKQRSRKR